MRDQPCGRIKLLQCWIAFFFVGEQFLNALQAFERFGAHAILHQDFRLQHQVLQGRCAQTFFFSSVVVVIGAILEKREAITLKRFSSILPRSISRRFWWPGS